MAPRDSTPLGNTLTRVMLKHALDILYPNSNVKGLSSTVSQIVWRDDGLVPPIHNIPTHVTVSNSIGSSNNLHSLPS